MFELHQVAFHYDHRPVLADLNLTVEDGSWVSIVGPSGIGKSTLLFLLAGFLKPTEGSVRFRGTPVTGPAPARGIVLQDLGLFPWLSVIQNVRFGLELQRLPAKAVRSKALAALELVRLRDHADDPVDALSGGMRQRVALARTLVMDPDVLLLDEAFSALDANTRQNLAADVRQIHDQTGVTTVLVTHSIDEALAVSDRIIALNGQPAEIRGDLPLPAAARRPEDKTRAHLHDLIMAWIA